jgi:hypothetical protein
MTKSDAAREYLASMLAELGSIAKREGLEYLAYMVAMAEEEARSHVVTLMGPAEPKSKNASN